MRSHILLLLLFCVAGCGETRVQSSDETFDLKVFGFNDFHGQVLPVKSSGGMSHLSKQLLHAVETNAGYSLILHAGDHVGASPAESSLLQDEPSIDFLNHLNTYCHTQRADMCSVIGIAGNHEFDEGSDEMLRLLKGGNHKKGPFIHPNWQGANYSMLSANVFNKVTQKQLLEPYVIKNVNGVDIGIIGITLDSTPQLVLASMVENLHFMPQAKAVDLYTRELQSKGVESIIVIVHDGTEQDYYQGETQQKQVIPMNSNFGRFLSKLPTAVDLVVSGHTHLFTNTYVTTDLGHKLLVTQAMSNGKAYADITLTISKPTGHVVASKAEVVKVGAAANVELSEQAQHTQHKVDALVVQASDYAKRYTETVINTFEPSVATIDEKSTGQFLADAYQYVLKTDVAVMNEGGVRAVLESGNVTWGHLFSIQPFGNIMEVRQYNGKQLKALIELKHFWSRNVLKKENGDIYINHQRIKDSDSYSVAGNSYVMGIAMFKEGQLVRIGESDMDTSLSYVNALPTPFNLSSRPVIQ